MTLIDPRTKHLRGPLPKDDQPQPGLTTRTTPRPDHGEDNYVGSGRLEGRRALITGGDSGIGRAVAIAFAREGARVAINYLPAEQEDAEATASLIDAPESECVLLPGDLTDEDTARQVVRDAHNQLGGLDLLVLNAAYQKQREADAQIPTDEFDRVMRTNLYAPFWMAREALPLMPPGSSVIVTTSIQAFSPSPALLDYAMTKGALAAFVQALASEQGEKGIRVNGVAPGPIWTPLIPATGWPDNVPNFGSGSPLGRPGQPAEVAGAYVYLASEDASYTSGAILGVSGGEHL